MDIGDASGEYETKKSISYDDYTFAVVHDIDWGCIALGCRR